MGEQGEGILRFGEFEIDERKFSLTRAGVGVEVAPRVYDVIIYLIRHRDRTVGKEELLEHVWGQRALSDSAIARCVSTARKVLGSSDCIKSVHGRGYRWTLGVERPSASRGSERPSSAGSPEVMVGRGREMRLLESLLRRVSSGRGGAALVSGEPGIGKSRLLEALERLATRAGLRAAWGCAPGSDVCAPYQPWSQIVGALGTHGDALPEQVARLSALAADDSSPAGAGSCSARARLLETIADALCERARAAATVLIVDDLHRADTGSIFLFETLAERVQRAPLLLVAAFRATEMESDWVRAESIRRCVRHASPLSLELGGLSVDETREVLGIRAGGQPSLEVARAARRVTGGNPFFLVQIAHLLSEGMEARELARALPSTVRIAIEQQLEIVAPACRSLLALAAVIGPSFPAHLLASAAQLDLEEVLMALRGLPTVCGTRARSGCRSFIARWSRRWKAGSRTWIGR